MKNEFIGLLVEDTPTLLVGLMAILKSGNCIVPISPGFPVERVEFIVKDCRIRLLLTDKRNDDLGWRVARSCSCLEHVICIDDREFKGRDKVKMRSLPAVTAKEDMEKPCYAIFTSGSTGKPKGVPITYGNLVPLLLWFHNYFKLGGHIRVLQNLSYTFDFGMFELLTTLLAGGTLYFFNKKALKDIDEYVDFIYLHQVNCIHTTPSFFNNIVGSGRKLSPLKLIHLGGEQLSRKLVEEISKAVEENCYIYNGYGPTETTINSSIFSWQVKAGGREEIPGTIPIGKPSANNIIYILDAGGMFQPPGISGELYITGSGVAPGYLNNPDLTIEKFCLRRPGTFLKKGSWTSKNFLLNHSPLYQTGDLGRWLADGNIEFFGRIDHQVKIRGFRIELGEIENRLLAHEEIKECAVIVREGEKGSKYLCAYLVARSTLGAGVLREYSAAYLPDYMTPAYFVMVDKMPLTTSGKTDLRALPEPGLEVGGYTAPRDEVEEKLAGIWAEVLGVEKGKIGIEANFFELGGHSLKATLLTAKVHKEFQVKVPLVEIFKTPFIRGLAEIIKEAARDKYISLESVEKKEYYLLSSAQRRLYILQQMDDKGGISYNMPSVWVLQGTIDKSRFEGVFGLLTRRHESLRTSFHLVNEAVVQRVHKQVEFQIEKNRSNAFAGGLIKSFIRPFDLSRAPLLRVGLVKLAEEKHILLVDMNHITADGMSAQVLVRDFSALYAGKELPGTKVRYVDYAEGQNRERVSKKILEQGEYWKKEYHGEIPVLELPTDYARPAVQDFAGNSINFEINNETSGVLKTLALETGATLYIVLLALYTIFLAKLSSQEDIVIGSPVAGRRHVDLEKIIGMFVNTLALRNYPLGEKGFREFVGEVKETALKGFENQEYQYEDLVEQISVNRDAGRNPLFDTMFVLQNTGSQEIEIPGLKLLPYEYENKTSKFDLTLTVVEVEGKLHLTFEYSTKLFKRETVERFIAYFVNIIRGVVADSRKRISDFEIITEEERRRLLFDFNETEKEYPGDKTLQRLFEEQVEQRPNQVALLGPKSRIPNPESRTNKGPFGQINAGGGNISLTYRELNERSGKLAVLLIEKGIQPDTIVGIMVERSVEMIIGIMGILKSGGAYLPIDPEYPEERIDYMLKDSTAKLLVTTGDFTKAGEKLRRWEGEIYYLEELIRSSYPLTFLPSYLHHSSNLAYIIYTSGTTGKPKGVLVEHRSAVNVVSWYVDMHEVGGSTRILQVSDYTFDASVDQVFGALSSGAILYIVEKEIRLDTEKLRRYIIDHTINLIDFVPTLLKELLCYDDKLESLHTVISGGEKLDDLTKESIIEKGYRLVNQYGPTETTVDALALECSSERVSLGKPVANVKVYILDRYETVLPPGVVGELYIAGAGVTRGYLNRPELTCDKFDHDLWDYRDYHDKKNGNNKKFLEVSEPFFKKVLTRRRQKLYRTGDLACWLPDGNVEFLGRIDSQVKIRGYRIELGEIESRLSNYPGIKEAVVSVQEEERGDKYLCAYFVSVREYGISELRESLAKELPDYMLPSYFVPLEKIPLTPNGKIDRRALPGPGLNVGEGYTAPRNEIEKTLVGLWSDILGRDALHASQLQTSLGIDDNFFRLGGHSLKATILAAKLHKLFDVNVPLTTIFKTPRIRELAEYIKNAVQWEYKQVELAEKKEFYVLSSAQQRLHFLHHMDKDGTAYNISAAWLLEGILDKPRLEQSLRRLIRRHESFRTSIVIIGEEPVQQIHEPVAFEIEYYNLSTYYTDDKDDKIHPSAFILHHFIRAFDLSKAPLLRVGLVKLEAEKQLLLVDMHHITADGMSCQVLVRDFSALYAGKELPGIKVRYKDYAEGQNRARVSKKILEQGEYWKKEYEGEIPVLELPTDYARPVVQGFEGEAVNFEINSETSAALKTLALETGATLYIVLLALYNIFLAKLSSQEDIVVGSPLAGRKHADLEKIIGMFVNTLAFRNYPSGEKGFREFLGEVKEIALKGFENQEYQYEDLVEQISVNRDAGRNPLFDTMFVLQNTGPQEIEIPGLKLVPYEYENKTSKFDLTLTGVEVEKKLLFTFEYSTKLFKRETIERAILYFKNLVKSIVENKNRRISDLEILTEEEKNRILFEFNDTARAYPHDKTLHRLFEEQARRTPGIIALTGGEPRIIHTTYRELQERSDRLASVLKERRVKPGDIVAILVKRSIEMIVGILGILKSGAAYLPLNPEQPEARTHFMMKDSGARVLVLKEERQTGRAEENKNLEIISLDALAFPGCPASLSRQTPCPMPYTSPGNPAYVIYTSGSTGNPKGVPVAHVNISPLIHWGYRHLGINEKDRVIQNLSYYFDGSVWEIFIALTSGASLYMVPGDIVPDADRYIDFINRYRITVLLITPTHFQSLSHRGRKLSTLSHLCLGAEKLMHEVVKRSYALVDRGCRVFNMYGPTEATIISAVLEIQRSNWGSEATGSSVPIGRPVGNTALLVLDKYKKLCPVNIIGELYIGGDGLAGGYLNNPDLTCDKFDHDKKRLRGGQGGGFLEKSPPGRRRLYKTGDLVKWLPDGNIEYLGRIDHQVKIRGFRIELGEIENRLLSHEGIKESVVMCRNTERGDHYLCAYIVSGYDIPAAELRECLLKQLPDYMVPSHFCRLEKIPLTPNGKIDRRALPKPGLKVGESYTAPGNEIEKKLAALWSEVLCRDALHAAQLRISLGIADNFFEWGGHSLNAAILVTRLEKAFNVKIPLSEIFKNPRIRELAGYIKDAVRWKHEQVELVEKKEYDVLSSAQQRLYLLQQMDKDGTAYNISAAWLLEGIIDNPVLEQSLRGLIRRHESLRTSFTVIDEEPAQRIHEHVEFQVGNYKLQNTKYKQIPNPKSQITNKEEPFGQVLNACGGQYPKSQELRAKSYIKSFIRPFDLSKAPLLRVGLIKLEKDRHILLVDMHHIISDGMSTQVLAQDFSALYAGKELPEIKVRYKDYAEGQNRLRVSKKILEQGEYWKKEYEGEIPVLELPTDYARPAVQGFAGNSINFEINSEISGAIKALALETGATLYIVLLALYNIFLAKLSSQEDIVIGSPLAGRKHADLEKIIGMFVNTLAFRNYPSGEKGFRDFLGEVKAIALKGFENQEYQYEDLVEQIPVNRDAGRNPLFDTMFVLQNTGPQEIEIPGLKLIPYEYENKTSKFDLILTGVEVEKKLLFTFEYSTKLFKRETVERFITYFVNIIQGVVEDSRKRISDFEIITEEERRRILFDFNNTEKEYPGNKTLGQLFEEQVEQRPNQVALLAPKSRIPNPESQTDITYRELHEQSNRLAHLLIEKGVLPDTIVGIMMERSVEMVVGIMGILISGGAYLPIDPDYPRERVDFMLKDSGAKLLFTIGNLAKEDEKVGRWAGENVFLEEILNSPKNSTHPLTFFPFYPQSPTNLVYIIYTSGSTGNPKGVIVEQASAVNLLYALQDQYPFTPADTYLLKTSYIFDVSVTELFGWYMGGGRVTILEKGGEKDVQAILDSIERNGVSHINFVPSMFNAFATQLDSNNINRLSSLKYIFLAGETLLPGLVKKFRTLDTTIKLENIYGPTENSVYSSRYSLAGWSEGGSVPIGKPLPNIRLYIFDKYNRLQPPKIVGELTLAGMGLARGYLNRPELTAEKFDTFDNRSYKSYRTYISQKLYKTGDLARWQPDGNIEFLGRMDHQVKIRGFRVELGEIEGRLSKHPGIKEVVVSAREEESGDKYICAYIVAHKEFILTGLRTHLSRKLPDYMIPAYFVRLEKIPLTPNGKVDRKALPAPQPEVGKDTVAPREKTERKLAAIWSEILGVEENKVSIDANFFHLGGHSLKALVLITKIYKEMNVKVDLPQIFKNPTIRDLGRFIEQSALQRYARIELAEKREYYTLTSAQKRLYIYQQMDPGSTAYNMPSIFRLTGRLEEGKFQEVLARLVERHDVLRTVFLSPKGEMSQKIMAKVELKAVYEELADASPDEKIRGLIRPFDLTRAPLLRVEVSRVREDSWLLFFDIHHIISEGSSIEILLSDFLRLYQGQELIPLAVQYKDYAVWRNKYVKADRNRKQEQYWMSRLQGFVFSQLPVDHLDAFNRVKGSSLLLDIPSPLCHKMETFCHTHQVTKFIYLFTVFSMVLAREIDQWDITLAIPVSIRDHPDLKDLIGIFLNVLLIRSTIDPGEPFLTFLEKSKKSIVDALNNQDYPYELLKDNIIAGSPFKKNELFSIMFNYIPGDTVQPVTVTDFRIEPWELPEFSPKFDMTLYLYEKPDRVDVHVVYKSNLYREDTIGRLLGNFLAGIDRAREGPGLPVSQLTAASREAAAVMAGDDEEEEFEKYFDEGDF